LPVQRRLHVLLDPSSWTAVDRFPGQNSLIVARYFIGYFAGRVTVKLPDNLRFRDHPRAFARDVVLGLDRAISRSVHTKAQASTTSRRSFWASLFYWILAFYFWVFNFAVESALDAKNVEIEKLIRMAPPICLVRFMSTGHLYLMATKHNLILDSLSNVI
jgi:hypothetical protein